MKLLALYYREEMNLKAGDRKERLYEFCSKHIPGFSRARFYKMINKALAYASKKSNCFVVVDHVDIYKNEVDYINSLDISSDYKKCTFSFLVQMRLNKIVSEKKNKKVYTSVFFKGGMQKYSNIKKAANVNQKLNITSGFLRDMAAAGLIKVLHNGLVELLFVRECKQSGEIVIQVKDYQNVGWYLDYYNCVEKTALCKYCGQPFKQTKHDILYCSKHKDYYTPLEKKIIMCLDCGVEFEVDGIVKNKTRCDSCQKTYIRAIKTEKQREYRTKEQSVELFI